MLPLHATGYGGLLSESLNHVWASQAMLTMYEIEKETKRIMTTPFFNNLLFKMEQIYTLLCSFTLLILDS